MPPPPDLDVAIIGGGAAGLATAIFAGRRDPERRIAVFEGARSPGAKILVSGGSRCNVTNTVVTEADFNGGRASLIRRVLRALPVPETVGFFREMGVALREEAGGKLFPATNRSRDVLAALLAETARVGASLRSGERVVDLGRHEQGFAVVTSAGTFTAAQVVLATGGLSLPKSGSDGWGYTVARTFGHTIVPTTPALVPLALAADEPGGIHAGLSGVSLPVRLEVRIDGRWGTRVEGAMLWTHFGVSGPAVLDASRHWLRTRLDGRAVSVTANLVPSERFESLERLWTTAAGDRARLPVVTAVSRLVPGSVASAVAGALGISRDLTLAELTRPARRGLVHALLEWPLPIQSSRGYNYAEVTAGGVDLSEIDLASMASRVAPGLFLVGEILDVDGRIGGFNFQWAWATACIAGRALAGGVAP